MNKRCATCGKEFTGVVYSDGGIFALTHGAYQCRECYSMSHNFCPKCKDQPLLKSWKYCPVCGTIIDRGM